MAEFGPFSVDPSQVAGLTGADFAAFVVQLLDAERARAGIEGAALTATHRTNAHDGGVDAGLRRGTPTEWIPEGESAWQFKAGDLGPESCASELRNASEARAILAAGGSYRLALGRSITPEQIADRREALEAVVRELGIPERPGQIEVLNGDSLARWAEEFPAIASSPLIRGMNIIGQTFSEWSNSAMHRSTWVGSEVRDQEILDLRREIEDGDDLGVRVEGGSGFGKTRLVMEALRGQANEVLVVYVPSEDQFDPAVLSRLHRQGRAAVLVIDECDARRHDTFASMLQAGTRIRLLTIGERSSMTSRAPMIEIAPIDEQALTTLLLESERGLWHEGARVIVEMVNGDIDYALKCAQAVVAHRSMNARELITPDDVRRFVADRLPQGALFLASCALALFSRIGFDGEVEELSSISAGLGVPETDLRSAAAELTESGLMSSHGRYRSVGPSAVAIHLASRGWAQFGSRILSDLLPLLSDSQVERLFSRAAQIGDASLTRDVVNELLGSGGPLSSLEAVAQDRRGRMISNLAILSPARVTARIVELVSTSSDGDILRAAGARRPLVWALQKLAWHSSTFLDAADAMLRLAVLENESIANNSSAEWVGLFGTMLPSTAAAADTRLSYLNRKALSTDPRVRKLVVQAAERALSVHEWAMVSGEVQGGVVVERRGRPATWGEAWSYQRAMFDLLRALVDDVDQDIGASALQALVGSIQGHVDQPEVRDHMASRLSTLSSLQLREVRAKLSSLASLYQRGESDEEERVLDSARMLAGIQTVEAVLPEQSAEDRLWATLHQRAWDRTTADVEAEIVAALGEMQNADPTVVLLESLSSPIPADFSVGHLLAATPSSFVEEVLIAQATGPNSRAIVGYLLGREEQERGAIDRFIDGSDLQDDLKLSLTTQGPRSERAMERVRELLPRMSVATGARGVFFWARELNIEEVATGYLNHWLGRVETQEDYNAIVDFAAMQLYQRDDRFGAVEDLVVQIVLLRAAFPAVGQQSYDWERLASRLLPSHSALLVALFVGLVEDDSSRIFSDARESSLFKNAVELAGADAWRSIVDRIVVGGSFRLGFRTRGWLAGATTPQVAADWVGDSIDHARALASVASVGGAQLSPIVKFLINNFGQDDRVRSALVGDFVSGSWTGNESARIERQIQEVSGWMQDASATDAERQFCRRLFESLEDGLGHVRQEEQEEDW